MIREILKPNSNHFTIVIPNEYINKEIELIMFPLDSADSNLQTKNYIVSSNTNKTKNITNHLFGILKNTYVDETDYKKYLEDKYL